MDFQRLSQELVRAVRGKRSQTALSKRLGYRTNALYKWESGQDFPTAARFFQAAARCGIDTARALDRFYQSRPSWLADGMLTEPQGVAMLLREFRGRTAIGEIAARTGFTRFAVSRWLRGTTEPRLPQFLSVVEACSLRVLDFVACLVPPQNLPSISAAYRDLEATRRAAHDAPWTQAVLRCLELDSYRKLSCHEPGWIASRIGITPEEEARCLDLLTASGQVLSVDGHYGIGRVLTVDTRKDEAATRALRSFWTGVARARLDAGSAGVFSYNVFGVSERDLVRLRALYASTFQQMRAIIAASEPVEHVVVATSQLFALDERDARGSV
jgi:DNA-binding phage protein